MTGKVIDTERRFGKTTLRIVLDDMPETVPELVEIKERKKKRSLNANAYYWSLCGKLAEKLGVPNAWMHNALLQRYGAYEEIDGQTVLVYIQASEEEVMKSETIHFKRIGEDEFVLLKGSHEYNTKEMARLIDGTVDECNELGIKTLDDEEIERMLKNWKA